MTVSIGVFTKSGGYWKLEQLRKNATYDGSWGDVASPTITKIGPDRYALRFDGFDMGMGYEVGTTDLFEIGADVLNNVLYARIHEDNTGAVDEVRRKLVKDVKITFRPGTNSKYFDAIFTITGKQAKKIGGRYVLVPFSRSEIHQFSNGEYYREGAP